MGRNFRQSAYAFAVFFVPNCRISDFQVLRVDIIFVFHRLDELFFEHIRTLYHHVAQNIGAGVCRKSKFIKGSLGLPVDEMHFFHFASEGFGNNGGRSTQKVHTAVGMVYGNFDGAVLCQSKEAVSVHVFHGLPAGGVKEG